MAESHRDEIAKLEALYANNPEGRLFTHLAEAYRKAGDLQRAREVLDDGLQRHPDYSSAYVVRGRVLQDLGERAEAERAFLRVLELDAENRVAVRALAELAREDGRAAEALDYYRQLQSLDPTDEDLNATIAAMEAAPAAPTVTEEQTAPGTGAGTAPAGEGAPGLAADEWGSPELREPVDTAEAADSAEPVAGPGAVGEPDWPQSGGLGPGADLDGEQPPGPLVESEPEGVGGFEAPAEPESPSVFGSAVEAESPTGSEPRAEGEMAPPAGFEPARERMEAEPLDLDAAAFSFEVEAWGEEEGGTAAQPPEEAFMVEGLSLAEPTPGAGGPEGAGGLAEAEEAFAESPAVPEPRVGDAVEESREAPAAAAQAEDAGAGTGAGVADGAALGDEPPAAREDEAEAAAREEIRREAETAGAAEPEAESAAPEAGAGEVGEPHAAERAESAPASGAVAPAHPPVKELEAPGMVEWADAGPEEEEAAAAMTTETMAELYRRQGLLSRAADVYQSLLRDRPDDARLRARLEEIEQEMRGDAVAPAGGAGGAERDLWREAAEADAFGAAPAMEEPEESATPWTDPRPAPAAETTPYVWAEAAEEEAGPSIGAYLSGLLEWRPAEMGSPASPGSAGSEPVAGLLEVEEPIEVEALEAPAGGWEEAEPEESEAEEDEDGWTPYDLGGATEAAGSAGGAEATGAGEGETSPEDDLSWLFGAEEAGEDSPAPASPESSAGRGPRPVPPAEVEAEDDDLELFRAWLQSLKH